MRLATSSSTVVFASRRHCELWLDKGTWWVTDCGSTNGVRVGARGRRRPAARERRRRRQGARARPGARVVLSASGQGDRDAVPALRRCRPSRRPRATATPVTPIVAATRARAWRSRSARDGVGREDVRDSTRRRVPHRPLAHAVARGRLGARKRVGASRRDRRHRRRRCARARARRQRRARRRRCTASGRRTSSRWQTRRDAACWGARSATSPRARSRSLAHPDERRHAQRLGARSPHGAAPPWRRDARSGRRARVVGAVDRDRIERRAPITGSTKTATSRLDGIAPLYRRRRRCRRWRHGGMGEPPSRALAASQARAGQARCRRRFPAALLDADREIAKGIAHRSGASGAATVVACAATDAMRRDMARRVGRRLPRLSSCRRGGAAPARHARRHLPATWARCRRRAARPTIRRG